MARERSASWPTRREARGRRRCLASRPGPGAFQAASSRHRTFSPIASYRLEPVVVELFSAAHDIYLSRARDQDSLVSLGDYVIWRIERENVTRTLREDFGQVLLTASSFDTHQIRWGMLLRMLAEVRKRAYVADLRYALNVAPQNDPKAGLQCLFVSCATSFTRYVLQIDPSNSSNSQDTMDRFHASVGLGAGMLGAVYFHIIDLMKSARV